MIEPILYRKVKGQIKLETSRICEYCEKEFEARKTTLKTCSDNCCKNDVTSKGKKILRLKAAIKKRR